MTAISLCLAQQYVFEAYIGQCQKSPVGPVDLSKFRKFVHECETANNDLPKLGQEVIENIFDRAVMRSDRRLQFETFEKAVIIYAVLLNNATNAADAYISFVRRTLLRTPTLSSPNFPPVSNIDRISIIADALMEKQFACCFSPTVSLSLESLKREAPGLFTRPPDPLRPPLVSRLVVADRPPDPEAPPLYVDEAVQVSAPPAPLVDLSRGDLLVPSKRPAEEASVSFCNQSNPDTSVDNPGRLLSGYIGFPTRPYQAWCNSKPAVKASHEGKNIDETTVVAQIPKSLEFMARISQKFNNQLLDDFGCVEKAFKYFDECTGIRSGKITSNKFFYGCEAIGFECANKEVLRTLFRYIDFKSDGCIDAEELRTWREVQQRRRRRKPAG